MTTIRHEFSAGMACFYFSDKPSAGVRSALKANGYRWTPSGGYWWKRGTAGAADFLDSLRKLIDREAGIRRVDGPCWTCKAPEGFFRNHGAAAPVLCDACEAKDRAAYNARYQPRADYSDTLYEDNCRDACGA